MAPSFLSLASLYSSFLRRCFTSAGLTQQVITIDSDDQNQTTIHFWAPTNQALDYQKPSLVFIHGFGPVSLWQWRQQVQFFGPHFNLYVPDLVFFGNSTTKSSERSEIFQAESVAKLLEKLGVNKYSLVGTSYGGFVSYHIARMFPDRVDKVVMASSGVNMRRKDEEELVKRAKLNTVGDLMLPQKASDLRALLGVSVFRRTVNMIPDFCLNDFVKTLFAENRKEKLELLKGLTIGQHDSVNISPLQQEVLLLWGEQDQIFPLKMATELKGLIGTNVKLEIIKNSSHVPQIEHAAEFNNIVKNFLMSTGDSSR